MDELIRSLGVPAVVALLLLQQVQKMLEQRKKPEDPSSAEEVHRHYEEQTLSRIEKKLDRLLEGK